jgi:hypothetical protein
VATLHIEKIYQKLYQRKDNPEVFQLSNLFAPKTKKFENAKIVKYFIIWRQNIFHFIGSLK